NYGYTNFKWHSISHCDCDAALKGCLRRVNDTSSRVVGQAFFNVIDVPCFDLVYEEQCAERYWCKQYEKFPIAMLREAIPYEFGGIDVIDDQRKRHWRSDNRLLAIGTWNVTSLAGKEPELVKGVETYQVDIVVLTLHTQLWFWNQSS
uniref:Phospholipase A2-like central domain-containing protein n=1 Tax=Mola mola TaxID=94237 RepID=A0A3Q3WMM1_MOLML